ncbi:MULTISPECIES: YlbD family protein [unclassified Bacillus (in: firmicutes)]|uniref:YlbD family protein n=1 Tax=unclassified Bacillus (in: firmicutes) TaxID=185979 RepID=UPI0015CF02D1|nr:MULTISPECIES: YlbD family protein [unclassified Bacillus (in: firmicutes)]
MGNENSRPSIEQFRQFVMEHPKLREEVKTGNKTWQQYFEDWYYKGETHEMWDDFRNDGNKKSEKKTAKKEESEEGYVGKVISFVKNLDPDQIQDHLSNVNSTLTNIQQLISQFKSPATSTSQREEKPASQQFNFRQD